jgi:hypothetical protein
MPGALFLSPEVLEAICGEFGIADRMQKTSTQAAHRCTLVDPKLRHSGALAFAF